MDPESEEAVVQAFKSFQQSIDKALSYALQQKMPDVMKTMLEAGASPTPDLYDEVLKKNYFDSAKVLFAASEGQRDHILAAIAAHPTAEIIRAALEAGLPHDALIPVKGASEGLKLPPFLAHRGLFPVLARLLQDNVLDYDKAGVAAADMLPALNTASAEDAYPVLEDFGAALEADDARPALAAWALAVNARSGFPLSATLSERCPAVAAAVVRVSLGTEARAPMLRSLAQQANEDLLKFALDAGLPLDADYRLADDGPALRLPQALLRLDQAPLLARLIADGTITLAQCGVDAAGVWPHAHGCADTEAGLAPLCAVVSSLGEAAAADAAVGPLREWLKDRGEGPLRSLLICGAAKQAEADAEADDEDADEDEDEDADPRDKASVTTFPDLARAVVVAAPQPGLALEVAIANNFTDWIAKHWPQRAAAAPAGHPDWTAFLGALLQQQHPPVTPTEAAWDALCASPEGRAAVLASDGFMHSALRTAAANASETIKWSARLLQRADRGTGLTPLHVAAQAGDNDRVGFMMSSKALLDVRDRRWRTPLMLAAAAGLTETVALLAGGGKLGLSDADGFTAVHHACAGGHLDALKELVLRGASLEVPSHTGMLPLAVALTAGHAACVELINTENDGLASDTRFSGYTAMHFAAAEARGNQAALDAAVRAYPTGKLALGLVSDDGATPQEVFEGAACLHPHAIDAALKGDDVDALRAAMPGDNVGYWREQRNFTLLMQASWRGAAKCTEWLLQQPQTLVTVDKVSDESHHALSVAVLGGHVEVFKVLVKACKRSVTNGGTRSIKALAERFGGMEAVIGQRENQE
jgi:hypothetical protein